MIGSLSCTTPVANSQCRLLLPISVSIQSAPNESAYAVINHFSVSHNHLSTPAEQVKLSQGFVVCINLLAHLVDISISRRVRSIIRP